MKETGSKLASRVLRQRRSSFRIPLLQKEGNSDSNTSEGLISVKGRLSLRFHKHVTISDKALHRLVALKVIQPAEAYLDAAATERLLDEARILARLEHPGIVPVHDAGVLPDGNIYYTMKFVEGRRLDRNGSVPDLLRVFQKVCETVAFAHAHGIVHRDLKPENILVGSFGEVLVTDWGIAKIIGKLGEPAGTVVGTPEYMSPEQARSDV